MGRFILHRTVSAIALLIAISILTFLIFQVIPNGDPSLQGTPDAEKKAFLLRAFGKNPKPLTIPALKLPLTEAMIDAVLTRARELAG